MISCLFAPACVGEPLLRPVPESPEEPLAIAAALDSLFSWADEIFVEPQTIKTGDRATLPWVDADVIRDFERANREPSVASLPLPTRRHSRVLTEDERERAEGKAQEVWEGRSVIMAHRFFAALREDHPRAAFFVSFTRPGFNAARTEALVYVTIHCGSMCGEGNFVHLRRDGSRWVVRHIKRTWVS